MQVGIYSLVMYCDRPRTGVHNADIHFQDSMTEYTDEFGSRCRRKARKDGWVFHSDHTHTCPTCSHRRRV